ncbi:hypothetical protein GOP47_0023802 [Adiantum capillus-veneris]|uniref:Uncharacterized protein n=1 Tax=Adiantum capillus-veneris TaxID=13818 RepID=A0A9D4Z5H4_ADICA|nr:hypothetical protein GOP47_0023802 [Adiantum capillus-veneris]
MAPPKSQRSSHPKSRDRDSASAVGALISEAERQALAMPLSPPQEDETLFDLGEVYFLLGSTSQAKMYQNLGSILGANMLKEVALDIQSNATRQSIAFYRASHDMYEKVVARDSLVLKQEALINSGNSLCDWAELLPPAMGSSLFEKADLWYTAALSESADDVELLTNFADCKVKRAELEMLIESSLPEAQPWSKAKEFYSRAMSAYGHACSLADTNKGDDLAGLLQNWGASLSSLAQHTPDSQEALLAHDQAMEKLRNAAKFRPTDVTIFIAIGEACSAYAERIPQAQALELLATSVDEGFGVALKIDANCMDAILGEAESHLAAGKLARIIGMESAAKNHYGRSLNSYLRALQMLRADEKNECKLKFEEQCNVLYNLACVAALCSQESVAAEALTLLARVGGFSPSDLAEDADLQTLQTKEWFVSLRKKMIH